MIMTTTIITIIAETVYFSIYWRFKEMHKVPCFPKITDQIFLGNIVVPFLLYKMIKNLINLFSAVTIIQSRRALCIHVHVLVLCLLSHEYNETWLWKKKKYIAKRNSKFPGARKCATSFNQPGSQKPMPMVCKTKTQGLQGQPSCSHTHSSTRVMIQVQLNSAFPFLSGQPYRYVLQKWLSYGGRLLHAEDKTVTWAKPNIETTAFQTLLFKLKLGLFFHLHFPLVSSLGV